jgi:hypothetical protein
MQWNANSVTLRKYELMQFLQANRIDIAAICETKLSPRRKFTVQGYSIYRTDRNHHGGGVLLLLRNEIQHDSIHINSTSEMEMVSVIVHSTQQQRILIVAGYNPPNHTLSAPDLDPIFAQNIPTIVLGDFNSKHVAWNCTHTDRNGRFLLEYCTDHYVSIHAPLYPTHFPARGQPSVLDIALVKGCPLSSPQSLPILSSDHNPVVFKLRGTPTMTSQRLLYDYDSANWGQYHLMLDHSLRSHPRIQDTKDIDRAIHYFTAAVKTAADRSIPKRNTTIRRLKLPPEICTLMKTGNYFRRRYQRTRHIVYYGGLTLLNKVIANLITQYRHKKWTSFLRTLHPNNNQLWLLTRYYKKSREPIPPLMHQGRQYYMAEDKASLLAERFESNHRLIIPSSQTHHARIVDRQVNTFVQRKGQEGTQAELSSIITKLKHRTAPGEDAIPNILIRRFTPTTLKHLAIIFNAALRLGYFPTQWKHAKVLAIPKPKKQQNDPGSYRPISLLPALSKLLERAVATRITGFTQ